MNILFMRIGYTNPETNEFVFQKAEGEARVFIQKLLEYTVKIGGPVCISSVLKRRWEI